MSFNHYARKVRNPDLSIWTRLAALRSCILSLSVLTTGRFHEALERFDARFEFERYRSESPNYRWHKSEQPSEENLLAALNAIEIERNQLLENLRIIA
jgi:hypothetical protein